MPRVGYVLIGEEHPPEVLLDNAARAEEVGFEELAVSDHFLPWLADQGQAPFAWSLLGALTERTSLPLVTAVTCPTKRYHPAVVAQAAATVTRMAPAGLTLGVGSGENLNEHVVGGEWPDPRTRLEMLEEATGIIHRLWDGGKHTHRGRFFTVDRARLYTLPAEPPRLAVAAGGRSAAQLAARLGAGLMTVAPDPDLVDAYRDAGGRGPLYGQATICWGRDQDTARHTLWQRWRQSALSWDVLGELPTPEGFAVASQAVTADELADAVPVGPRLGPVLEEIRAYEKAGFDRVNVHNVGPDQEGFLGFAEEELLPHLAG